MIELADSNSQNSQNSHNSQNNQMDIDKNNDVDLFEDIEVFITKANPLLDNNKLTNLKTVLKGLETRQILNTKISSSQWILDTAAEAHIICNKNLYSEFKNTNKQVS